MEHFLPLAVASMVLSLISIMLLDYFGPTTSISESETLSTSPSESFEQSEDQVDKVSTEELEDDVLLEQQQSPTSNLPIPEESTEIKSFVHLKNIIQIGMSWSYRTIVLGIGHASTKI